MNFPEPSVIPEAVRNSVSIRSFSTFTLAGMTLRSSFSFVARHFCSPPCANAEDSGRTSSRAKSLFIRFSSRFFFDVKIVNQLELMGLKRTKIRQSSRRDPCSRTRFAIRGEYFISLFLSLNQRWIRKYTFGYSGQLFEMHDASLQCSCCSFCPIVYSKLS